MKNLSIYTFNILLLTLFYYTNSYKYIRKINEDINKKITIRGSTSVYLHLINWSNKFKILYPNVEFDIITEGSSSGPPALESGEADIIAMSRNMYQQEIDSFQAKIGYKPTEIRVSIDSLLIIVNKLNPIKGLNLVELDSIFSKTLRCGSIENVEYWSQLDVSGIFGSAKIKPMRRDDQSASASFLAKVGMCDGSYREKVIIKCDHNTIINKVIIDPHAIGYIGLNYNTEDVKTVPMALLNTKEYIHPSEENIVKGDYPFARFLNIFININNNNSNLNETITEFLTFILSDDGQDIVKQNGGIRIPKTLIEYQFDILNLDYKLNQIDTKLKISINGNSKINDCFLYVNLLIVILLIM